MSVVIPVCNEAGNVQALVIEIQAALRGEAYEIVFVDDGSSDATREVVRALVAVNSGAVRLLCHATRCGQSAALCTGVRAARAPWIATLDGDGQNDPADIPRLIAAAAGTESSRRILLVMGHRITRQDTWIRRASSRIANAVRDFVLGDETPDTGCGIKLFDRAAFLSLPAFNHMHRFLPALFQRAGAGVLSVPVNHRQRLHGQSKYGVGNRLWVGIADLFGVRWLMRRAPTICDITEE